MGKWGKQTLKPPFRETSPPVLGSNPSDQKQEGIYDSQLGLQAFCLVEELSKRTSDHSLEKEKKEGVCGRFETLEVRYRRS
jgi:hypothetical protein